MKKFVKIACFLMAFSFILQGCSDKDRQDNNKASETSKQEASYSSQETSGITDSTTSESSFQQSSQPRTSETQQPSVTSPYSKATATTAKTSAAASKPTYIKGILIANKSYPLPSDYNPGVDSTAQSAFNQMASAAASEGINLFIVSGFRSYSTQASIYNNYVAQDGKAAADRYSARPGHSEHQTGLAFDVNSLSQSFEDTPEGKWLAANCYKYGFIIRYPKNKESITGYMYEPWHIRYLGNNTAKEVFNSGLTLEEYLGIKSVYKN